jgi:hypothetical protein
MTSVGLARRKVKDGGDLSGVVLDVEIRVKDEPVWHHVDGGSDRYRHDTWVEVASEFPFGLEARELLFEEVGRHVDVPAVDAASAVGREGAVSQDLDDGNRSCSISSHRVDRSDGKAGSRRRQASRPARRVSGTRRHAALMAALARTGPGPSSVPGIFSPRKITVEDAPCGRVATAMGASAHP